MSLHARLVGPGRPNLLFLHGLFGQGRNWTRIAAALEPVATSVLFDLPNHGRSPRDEDFSYIAMADAVAHDLRERLGSSAAVTVLGHSMGGKVAMVLALRHPELVRALVVVDIAPDGSSHDAEFTRIIAALRGINLDNLRSREQADDLIADAVPDPVVRDFLLQNLRRRKHTWHWQVNLPVLERALPKIFSWPAEATGSYAGPVLWIKGENSPYIRPEHYPHMLAIFPRTTLLSVPNAGHWVHSDAPDVVSSAISDFLVAEGLDRPAP